MSRAAAGDVRFVPPTNNVYTVLAVVATLANLIGFILICVKYAAVFGSSSSLFQ